MWQYKKKMSTAKGINDQNEKNATDRNNGGKNE